MIRPICKVSEVLCKPCEKTYLAKSRVTNELLTLDELETIIKDLKDTLKSSDNLLCLSAPQIGELLDIFAIKYKDEIKVFINPEYNYIDFDNSFVSIENCNTDDTNKSYFLLRYKKVQIYYQDEEGRQQVNAFDDITSCLVQQMMDTLDGISSDNDDFSIEVLEEFNTASKSDREETLEFLTHILIDKTANKKKEELLKAGICLINQQTQIDTKNTTSKDYSIKYNRETRRKIQKEYKKLKKNK